MTSILFSRHSLRSFLPCAGSFTAPKARRSHCCMRAFPRRWITAPCAWRCCSHPQPFAPPRTKPLTPCHALCPKVQSPAHVPLHVGVFT
jgi:hypothetical protein